VLYRTRVILSRGDRVDRYEIVELLGAGGMGEVYSAHDPKLARLVALKILRVTAAQGTGGAAKLLREARAAAALSHANVLAVYDVGEVEEPESLRGLAYIAMELVVGKPLRAYLGDGDVPMEQRIGWLRDVANALGAAHQAGIVHRDVKPENVMVRFDGAVKVLDFGIARRAVAPVDLWSSTEGRSVATLELPPAGPSLASDAGALVGTPFFMAPEQLRGEPLDGRTDQFAWGVMAYMLLTGTPPWTNGTEPVAILSQILSFDPPSPREMDERIQVALSDAVQRAMAKRREARFASMGELVRAMDSEPADAATASAAPPREATRDPPPQRAEPPGGMRRERASVGRVAGLALAVAVAGGTTVVAFRGAHAPRDPATPTGEQCSSNRQCVAEHGGEAWHCHTQRHVCVEVASPDCKVYAEPHAAEADDVVWFGGMFPLADPNAASEMRATDLARQDFAQALGPSSARAGGLHARPIGLAICDEGADALRAARHLADDVQVPAVIGFRSSAGALATISTVFLPSRVLSFVSISQAPAVTKIPEPAGEPRLVWRSTLNRDYSAAPLAHLVSDVLEPSVRAGPRGIGERPLKVAAVWSKAATQDLVESFFGELRFNGASALENGANFRQLVYDGSDSADAGDVVDALLAFAPNVILFEGRGFASSVLAPLETRWASGPRPYYLTGSGLGRVAIDFAGQDPSRRRRFFAATNVSTTMTNAALVLRYNLAFPAEPIIRTEAPQPSYDAFYVLAYGLYALGDGAVSGPALSGAIGRLLPPGRRVDVGPAHIFDAFETLRSDPTAHVDLGGAIGSLDFDPATGEAPIDYAIVCPGVDDHGAADASVESGLVYDARAKKLVGALRCP
jgi:hypothetical protein